MFHLSAAKVTGAAILTLSLAACMDISMEVEILSDTDARGTMTTTMASDIYAMVAAQEAEGDDGFCDEGELVETAETVSCVVTETGPFESLELSDDGSGPSIEAIGGGQVRVSFPLGELSEEIGEGMGAGEDPEMMAMMASMFEGNTIAMIVSGGRIVDTNMDIAADGMSATYVIPFVDLLTGDVELPEEAYAVVQK